MITFVVNCSSASGQGGKVWTRVKDIMKKEREPYRVYYTEYKGHAAKIAAHLSRGDEDHPVVLLGGDGTINEFINGIHDFHKIRLGVIPAGSGNDFVNGLGLPASPEKALEAILRCSRGEHGTMRIDLGRIDFDGKHRYFAISSGMGLDAIVCRRAQDSRLKKLLNTLHLGKLVYLILTVSSLFSMETSRVRILFRDGVRKRAGKMIFFAAMNLPAEGGGVPMAPRACADDGRLSFCLAGGVPKWKTFFLLPFLALARHEKLKCFAMHDSAGCRVTANVPVVIHADGEYVGTFRDVTYRCIPGVLELMV